jgi:hypothetical protein
VAQALDLLGALDVARESDHVGGVLEPGVWQRTHDLGERAGDDAAVGAAHVGDRAAAQSGNADPRPFQAQIEKRPNHWLGPRAVRGPGRRYPVVRGALVGDDDRLAPRGREDHGSHSYLREIPRIDAIAQRHEDAVEALPGGIGAHRLPPPVALRERIAAPGAIGRRLHGGPPFVFRHVLAGSCSRKCKTEAQIGEGSAPGSLQDDAVSDGRPTALDRGVTNR